MMLQEGIEEGHINRELSFILLFAFCFIQKGEAHRTYIAVPKLLAGRIGL